MYPIKNLDPDYVKNSPNSDNPIKKWAKDLINISHKRYKNGFKRCSTLVIKEMEIQTTVKYHFTATNKIVIIQKDNEKCWEDLEKLKLSYGSLVRSFKKKKKKTTQIYHDSAIPFLGIYPKDMKTYSHTDVHSSITHSDQKAETIQMSINL